MIPVTDCVMYLDCQRQQPFSIPLKELTHGENRQQELAVIVYVEIAGGKLQPGNHGDIKGILGRAVLGCIACGFGIDTDILVIVFEKIDIIL